MVKAIPNSLFSEGLKLCEENVERLLKYLNEFLKVGNWLCAFLLGVTILEELVKENVILENWEKDSITDEMWKEFTRGGKAHKIKIKKAKELSASRDWLINR